MTDVRSHSAGRLVVRPTGPFGDSVVRSIAGANVGRGLTYGIDVDVDLRHVCFIDADTVCALAGLVRRVEALGGRARLFNVRSRVRWRLELADLREPLSSSRQALSRDVDVAAVA